jgi:hypothetical protein
VVGGDDMNMPIRTGCAWQWVEKFKFCNQYPIVGRVSTSQRDRVFTLAELQVQADEGNESLPADGQTKKATADPKRVDSEILLAVTSPI